LALALGGCSSNSGGPGVSPDTVAFLDSLQHKTFNWFWDLTPASNGLTPDRWPTPSFSSIAAVGFALTGYGIGVERGWITRQQAADRTLATLRFFWTSAQDSAGPNTTGYRGFYYHFLDMTTGRRFQTVELSTIDTSLLLGGVLFAQSYFTGSDTSEKEIRALADSIYRRYAAPLTRIDDRFARRLLLAGNGALVAAVGDEVVGIASIGICENAVAEVALLVEDGWQRQGLGTQLLSGAARLARGQGASEVVLRSRTHNPALMSLASASGLRARIKLDGDTVVVTVGVEGLKPLTMVPAATARPDATAGQPAPA